MKLKKIDKERVWIDPCSGGRYFKYIITPYLLEESNGRTSLVIEVKEIDVDKKGKPVEHETWRNTYIFLGIEDISEKSVKQFNRFIPVFSIWIDRKHSFYNSIAKKYGLKDYRDPEDRDGWVALNSNITIINYTQYNEKDHPDLIKFIINKMKEGIFCTDKIDINNLTDEQIEELKNVAVWGMRLSYVDCKFINPKQHVKNTGLPELFEKILNYEWYTQEGRILERVISPGVQKGSHYIYDGAYLQDVFFPVETSRGRVYVTARAFWDEGQGAWRFGVGVVAKAYYEIDHEFYKKGKEIADKIRKNKLLNSMLKIYPGNILHDEMERVKNIMDLYEWDMQHAKEYSGAKSKLEKIKMIIRTCDGNEKRPLFEFDAKIFYEKIIPIIADTVVSTLADKVGIDLVNDPHLEIIKVELYSTKYAFKSWLCKYINFTR